MLLSFQLSECEEGEERKTLCTLEEERNVWEESKIGARVKNFRKLAARRKDEGSTFFCRLLLVFPLCVLLYTFYVWFDSLLDTQSIREQNKVKKEERERSVAQSIFLTFSPPFNTQKLGKGYSYCLLLMCFSTPIITCCYYTGMTTTTAN